MQRRLWCFTLVSLLLLFAAPDAHAQGPAAWPLPGPVVREFDPPEQPWLPGHRGIDLAGHEGEAVVATADGTVTFAGTIVDRGVVVVQHGDARTTYEPVTATARVGQDVRAGEPIGRLQAGHAGCPAAACLHWGLKRGDDYLDPRGLFSPTPTVALVPLDAQPTQELGYPAMAGDATGIVRPVAGPVTSGFGYRVHPILGQVMFHDGTDFGAACGMPIRAVAPGMVAQVAHHPSCGLMVRIDHGRVGLEAVQTVSCHARATAVQAGQRVATGQVVAYVGSTGRSTGCHLHFNWLADGAPIDPLSRLPAK